MDCGPEKIRELVENDWKEWQDLTIDIQNAHIHAEGNCAWVTTKATCTLTYTMDQIIEFSMNMIKSTLDNPDQSTTEKLAWLNQVYIKSIVRGKTGKPTKIRIKIIGCFSKKR